MLMVKRSLRINLSVTEEFVSSELLSRIYLEIYFTNFLCDSLADGDVRRERDLVHVDNKSRDTLCSVTCVDLSTSAWKSAD